MIGDNIRRLRKEHGYTQEQLGRELGLSAMAISQWENGRAVPRMGAVERMAKLFGVKKSVIIDEVRYSYINIDTDEERELIAAFRKLDARDRAAVLQLAHTLSGSDAQNAKTGVA